MPRKDEAAALLRQCHSPSEIAKLMQVRASEVMNYLCTKIGEGDLRRSDIAFSLKRELRKAIEEVAAELGSLNAARISRELLKRGINCSRYDVRIYMEYRRARVVLGDMYEIVRNIEVRLHGFIKYRLMAEYGEENWWRSGVPEKIRAECAALREKDPEPAPDAYCYTHLIALREVLDKAWPVLSKHLPGQVASNKKELLDRLLQLNRIRNAVMHPVRGDHLSEEEFEFAYALEADLGALSVPAEAMAEPRKPEAAKQTESGEHNELVSKLAPVEESQPAEEFAATTEQASGEEFIPSVKAL
jgi:predicted transcriptional regulator